MRKMRKLISVSLVLSMLCLFTACGTDKKNNANDMAGTGTENNATTDNETAGNNTTGNGTTADNGTTTNNGTNGSGTTTNNGTDNNGINEIGRAHV